MRIGHEWGMDGGLGQLPGNKRPVLILLLLCLLTLSSSPGPEVGSALDPRRPDRSMSPAAGAGCSGGAAAGCSG